MLNSNLLSIAAVQGTPEEWTVGTNGAILHSADAGETWHFQKSGATSLLYAVRFLDARNGWVAGDRGLLLHTSDGGNNWQAQSLGGGENLRGLAATDARHIWVFGEAGAIYATNNGGTTWARQDSTVPDLLDSGQFVTPSVGWAAGENGAIVRTSDGGAHWSKQESNTHSALNDLSFADSRVGWAVGNAGVILRTADGGATWQKVNTGAKKDLDSISFSGTIGLICGDGGTVLRTDDGGATWSEHNAGTFASLWGIHLLGRHAISVGKSGTIVESEDAGRSWKPKMRGEAGRYSVPANAGGSFYLGADGGRILEAGTDAQTRSLKWTATNHSFGELSAATPSKIWAVATDGELLSTGDGGRTWRIEIARGLEASFYVLSVSAVTEKKAWAAALGHIIATEDGGLHWTSQLSTRDDYSNQVLFLDENAGWAVGPRKTLRTDNGGRNWESVPVEADLDGLSFPNHQDGWAVGEQGAILATHDSGHTWTSQESHTSTPLLHVYFTDPQHGWAVGYDGLILATNDAGGHWAQQPSHTRMRLTGVRFLPDGLHGIISGLGGTLLSTGDGGQTWTPVIPSPWPSAWYYLSWLVTALVFYPALRRPDPNRSLKTSIADKLVSDRPLQPGDFDGLGLRRIANGLSRFLQNVKTKPPFTVAITGRWGSGKSSLMNLLRADLVANHYCPVWFNAWHNQKEDSLLAALFQAIKSEAVPPIWRIEGLIFRGRLLYIRIARNWVPVLAFLVFLAASVGWAEQRFAGELWETSKESVAQIGRFLMHLAYFVLNKKDSGPAASTPGDLPAGIVYIGAMLTAAGYLLKWLNAFGVKPASLIESKAGKIDEKTNFRLKFAQQFADVTWALQPRTMTIFIDDLDRCKPEGVLDTLETTNFLVSSGDCFIVLGLAPDQVQASVGLAFKDLADEMVAMEAPGDNRILSDTWTEDQQSAHGRRRRQEYAEQYLRKLINMEIAVPGMSPLQSAAVLSGDEVETDAVTVPPADLRRTLRIALRELGAGIKAILAPSLFGLALIAAFMTARYWPQTIHTTDVQVSRAPMPDASAKIPVAAVQGEKSDAKAQIKAIPVAPQGNAPAPEMITSTLHTGWQAYLVLGPMVLLLLAGGWWIVVQKRGRIVDDSQEFFRALKIWQPALERLLTPRALKRFLNKVRYLAMLQREAAPGDLKGHSNVNEPVLVCLAATEEYDSNLVASADPMQEIEKLPKLHECLLRHRAAFGRDFNKDDIDHYRELSTGLRVH